MGKQWVCHISGQGEKWELEGNTLEEYSSAIDWCVKAKTGGSRHFVPKSEYRLCDPPERWVDVTKEVTVKVMGCKDGSAGHYVMHGENAIAKLICGGKYRLTFIDGLAQIEKKVTE